MELYALHRVKNGWRENVILLKDNHLPSIFQHLRKQADLDQWFIVRLADSVVIAQSKDCQWTVREY